MAELDPNLALTWAGSTAVLQANKNAAKAAKKQKPNTSNFV